MKLKEKHINNNNDDDDGGMKQVIAQKMIMTLATGTKTYIATLIHSLI